VLFGIALPEGFHYRDDFIDADEERELLDGIGRIEFSTFEMRGVTAKRRVAFFGATYLAEYAAAPPIPGFLKPLRARIAEWAGVGDAAYAMALINEYPPGAPIGWHRDAPQYEMVAGVSLLSSCRMKLRPYLSPGAGTPGQRRVATHEISLARRSAYVMRGPARRDYEHHIPPVAALRYSITFRTIRS
jgi:alkylated DNA repair dioxygenase AlkB